MAGRARLARPPAVCEGSVTEGAGSDEALVTAARRGDATAFDALVRAHTTRMYRVALRILGDPSEAEDAVQDAWVSAWRSLSSFRSDASAGTWLFRIVTNAALSQVRRRRSTVPLDPADDTAGPAAPAHADPERSALRGEEVDRVHRAIATLEPSQRVPLVLRELEGLSYEEVADVLDVNPAALRSRLHRARASLLATLRNDS